MKKLILLISGVILFCLPGFVLGEEQQENQKVDITFFVDPIARPESLEFELVLRNNSDIPTVFEFPTSQQYEIIVKDVQGKEVYRFSKDRFFTQALEQLKLKAGESVSWKEKWDYKVNGERVKEGKYIVLAQLKATKVNNQPIKGKLSDSKDVFIFEENPVFTDVKATGEKGTYEVTGKARLQNGQLYYTVEDGHNEYVTETAVELKDQYPHWSDFTIDIKVEEDKLPDNGTLILNLYERKDNKMIHLYPVILEKFY